MKRRSFFKAVGLSGLFFLKEESSAKKLNSTIRKPYVTIEDRVVEYVGEVHKSGFIGGKIVLEVGEFDGKGYPVLLQDQNFYKPGSKQYYDFELACLIKAVQKVKQSPEMVEEYKQYNNIHSYVRTLRARGIFI